MEYGVSKVQEQAIGHCNVIVDCIFLEFFSFHLLRISTVVSVPFVTAEQKKWCWKVILWLHQTPLVFSDRDLPPSRQNNFALFYIASSGSVHSRRKPKPGPIRTKNTVGEKGSSAGAYINSYAHNAPLYVYCVYVLCMHKRKRHLCQDHKNPHLVAQCAL